MPTVRLFVYGSLLRGERHHGELSGVPFVRVARTIAAFTLYDLGEYPVLARGGHTAVAGEIYEVPEEGTSALDKFEGEGYRRDTIELEGGDRAEAYVLAGPLPHGAIAIVSGSWRDSDRRGGCRRE